MLKELMQSKISLVGGGDCHCCCKRNPPVDHYMGVFAELKATEEECRAACASNPRIYAGFMHCDVEYLNCSVLTNAELAAKITYNRKEYPKYFMGVDLNLLRGISSAY